MMKKTLLTVIAIAAIALCACQTQGNKIGANATDIGGKTWTDGFEFFTATRCDSGFNCEGGTLHEGGLLLMLVPAEEGFVSAKGFRGVDKNDSDYWEGFVFNGDNDFRIGGIVTRFIRVGFYLSVEGRNVIDGCGNLS